MLADLVCLGPGGPYPRGTKSAGTPGLNWGPCGRKAEILQLRQPCPSYYLQKIEKEKRTKPGELEAVLAIFHKKPEALLEKLACTIHLL